MIRARGASFLKQHYSVFKKTATLCKRTFCVVNSVHQWHIVSAVCLERKPFITKDLTDIEKRHLHFLNQIEVENSHLSDHEVRHIRDLETAEKLKKGELDDLDVVAAQTAQDMEESNARKMANFTAAPRVYSQYDKDFTSVFRKMDESLMLVVQQKLGNDYKWLFPQAVNEPGETLRQTAERCLIETCGDGLKLQFMGNAPMSFYKYKYPKIAKENGICGAKVFFFKANLQGLHPKIIKREPLVNDHRWLTYSEIKEIFQPVYFKAIDDMLIPDVPYEKEEASC